MDDKSEEKQKQLRYCNGWMSYWAAQYKIGNLSCSHLRIQADRFLGSEAGRTYWDWAGCSWGQVPRGHHFRAIREVFDEALEARSPGQASTDTAVDAEWIAVRLNRARNEIGAVPSAEASAVLAKDLAVASKTLLGQLDLTRVPEERRGRLIRAIEASAFMIEHGGVDDAGADVIHQFCLAGPGALPHPGHGAALQPSSTRLGAAVTSLFSRTLGLPWRGGA